MHWLLLRWKDSDAHAAIFNAIKRCEKQYVVGEEVAKKQQELKEYNKIKNDIHAKLGNAHQWQSPLREINCTSN